MNPIQRLTFWLVMMLFLLGIAGIWSFEFMQTQRRFAQLQANDTLKCQAIADKISMIRSKAEDQLPVDDMNTLVQLIQQAASEASMSMNHVQRIRPSSSRRIGQTPYIQTPTQLSLNQVSMQDTVTFLHHLATNQSNLQIQSLRFTYPSNRQPTPKETWQVEVGLASITYDPQKRNSN